MELIGKSHVDAQERNNMTGVQLEKGKNYLFVISDLNDWRDDVQSEDSGFQASPFVGWPYEKKMGLKYPLISVLAKPFCFCSFASIMELVGQVNDKHFRIGKYAYGVDINGTRYHGSMVKSPASGNLIVRANDPIKDIGYKYYKNNHGSLKLSVYVKPE